MITTTRIAKDFHWEMAHRLHTHDGDCRNVHGHSYTMWVEIEGEVDASGMILDFHDLKTAVEPLIKQLDHAFICFREDDVMAKFFRETGLKVFYTDFPTTTEHIAAYLAKDIARRLKDGYNLRMKRLVVRLHETVRVYAEVSLEF
jgi:6-pyruvoyltetrahydropterin/6-carboxytetrahydropterin synthase